MQRWLTPSTEIQSTKGQTDKAQCGSLLAVNHNEMVEDAVVHRKPTQEIRLRLLHFLTSNLKIQIHNPLESNHQEEENELKQPQNTVLQVDN